MIEAIQLRAPAIGRLVGFGRGLVANERVRLALSIYGYLTTAVVILLITFNTAGFAHDVPIWDRTGDMLRSGASPYGANYDRNLLFLYAPPWALIFAAVTWLPQPVQVGGLFALEVLAWRICAGSWRRVGYLGVFPVFGFELAVGQINLLIAAAVALALRGDGRWAVVAAFAKLSPVLAIRDVRRPLYVALLFVLATAPVFWLWGEWLRQVIAYAAGGDDPIPYWVRLAVGIALVATRRRWAAGLAVFVAIPNVTPNSYVLLAALMPQIPRGRATVVAPAEPPAVDYFAIAPASTDEGPSPAAFTARTT